MKKKRIITFIDDIFFFNLEGITGIFFKISLVDIERFCISGHSLRRTSSLLTSASSHDPSQYNINTLN